MHHGSFPLIPSTNVGHVASPNAVNFIISLDHIQKIMFHQHKMILNDNKNHTNDEEEIDDDDVDDDNDQDHTHSPPPSDDDTPNIRFTKTK